MNKTSIGSKEDGGTVDGQTLGGGIMCAHF